MPNGGTPRRLTTTPGIDTSPSFSPDGSRIVFESDRSGSQQLYVMNADGSSQRRISFGGGGYASPVWSPRGDLIAFTRIGGGDFRIGVMSPGGGGERLLTNAWQDEGPSWAPNGQFVMFHRTAQGSGQRHPLCGQHQRRPAAAHADPGRRIRPGLVAAQQLSRTGKFPRSKE